MSVAGWFLALCLLLTPGATALAKTDAPAENSVARESNVAKADAKGRMIAKRKKPRGKARVPRKAGHVANAATLSFPKLDTFAALQTEVASARAVAEADSKNVAARERLANAGVIATEFLLSAEALGDNQQVADVLSYINLNLADVGWRLGYWAKTGNLRATQALGVLQAHGVVLALDREKACLEFKKAAEEFPTSAWRRAQCLLNEDPDEAWSLMERAALLGHAGAQEWVARRCLGEFGATGRDFSCAREWLQRSAASGRARSQTLLGYLLNAGFGGDQDSPGALRLYRLAAQQGDADAQNNLGEIYEMGRGVEKRPGEALRWYLSAAEKGLAVAQFNAGRMLAVGAAGNPDQAHARRWLVSAEEKGIAQARKVLDWLDGGSQGLETAATRSRATAKE